MKMKKYLTVAVVIASLLSGCNDKWLNEVKPEKGELDPKIITLSEDGITTALVGIHGLIRNYSATGANHVSRGYMFCALGYEFMGNDVISNPSQWWGYEAGYSSIISNKAGYQANHNWRMYYTVINNCNSLIKALNDGPTPYLSDQFRAMAIGECRAVRGWAYFQLARIYSLRYKESKDKPCVPVYTEDDDAQQAAITGMPRKSVEQVYAQMLSDLSDGNIATLIADPPARASNIFRFRQDVAYAWRAIIKLYMENWAGAVEDAQKVAPKYPLMTAQQYASGFNTTNQEVIWAGPFSADQAVGYASLFSMLDTRDGGYKNFYMNADFQKLFSATDIRGQIIVPSVGYCTSVTSSDPSHWAYWTSKKFRAQGGSIFSDGDYIYTRGAEMWLVIAEGKARTGDNAGAADALFTLQSARDPKAVKSVKTGDALIEEILVERRKELVGEVGVEYFDCYRLNRPMNRTGNQPSSVRFTIPQQTDAKGTPLWTLQIPRTEAVSNPAIDDSPESLNPVRPQPTPATFPPAKQ